MSRLILINILWLLSLQKINGQIINYVNNGSFEEVYTSTISSQLYFAKYWNGTDSTKYYGEILSRIVSPIKVPLCNYTYQWPRSGNNDMISLLYCPTCPSYRRGYPRNRLKQVLKSNTTYCLSFYVNLSNNSSYGIDAIGGYLSDNSTDTIKLCSSPITYLTPQVENTLNNNIIDTLAWTLIRGSFIASGNEKYLLIGNFNSDANTNKIFVNPTYSPAIFSDYLIDDVSLIELNLPAFAGRDTSIAPGNNVFLGRQPDVGIDEACVWYKLPSMVPIANVAGFWVNPTTTSTYVVVQTICGLVKSDTVVVHMNLVGIDGTIWLNGNLNIFPNPVENKLSFSAGNITNSKFIVRISNLLGQELFVKDNFKLEEELDVSFLPNGIYYLKIENESGQKVFKVLKE